MFLVVVTPPAPDPYARLAEQALEGFSMALDATIPNLNLDASHSPPPDLPLRTGFGGARRAQSRFVAARLRPLSKREIQRQTTPSGELPVNT